MDIESLLTAEVHYDGPVLSAVAVEELVDQARTRHRRRLATLARLTEQHREIRDEMSVGVAHTSTVWDVVSATFGPDAVGPHVQNLLRQIGIAADADAPQPTVAKLEERVEAAQRRVVQLATRIDRLSVDRAALSRESAELHERIAIATHDAGIAARAILAVQVGIEGAPQADRERGEARILALEDDLLAHQRTADRLGAVLRIHHDFLRLAEALRTRLTELHAAASGVLEALDAELTRVASQAQADDLARALSGSLRGLRDSVARVNRAATEGAVLLTENLDRLAEEVDLLVPTDAAAADAEQEVTAFLRNRSVGDAVARARSQVALRRQIADLTGRD